MSLLRNRLGNLHGWVFVASLTSAAVQGRWARLCPHPTVITILVIRGSVLVLAAGLVAFISPAITFSGATQALQMKQHSAKCLVFVALVSLLPLSLFVFVSVLILVTFSILAFALALLVAFAFSCFCLSFCPASRDLSVRHHKRLHPSVLGNS